MFDKILIVNCGEIVCCVMIMVCWLGVKIVVVYLDVDVNVNYVQMVDEVVLIGLVFVVESYL